MPYIRRDLLCWQALVGLVILLSQPYWIIPLTYVFLSSFLIAPSGLIPFLAICTSTFWPIATYVSMFRKMARLGRPLKAARARALEDLPGAEEEYVHQRKLYREKMSTRSTILPVASLPIICCPILAFTLWAGIKDHPLVYSEHKLQFMTTRQHLIHDLKDWRKRGVFQKFDPPKHSEP